MEYVKIIAVSVGYTAMIVSTILVVAAFYMAYKDERYAEECEKLKSESENLARAVSGNPVVVGLEFSLDSLLLKFRHAVRRLEGIEETAKDAHKRIDDNRKLVFLMECYYDERLTELEKRLDKKAK